MASQSPLPRRLKEARLNKGISQKELGVRAGIDEYSASPRMNQYENGVHAPDYQIVERIAKQLSIPSCYLYCVEEDVAALLIGYCQLSATEKKRLIKTLGQDVAERVEN